MPPRQKKGGKKYEELLLDAETTSPRHWHGSGADANSPTKENPPANENMPAKENLSAEENPAAEENPRGHSTPPHLHTFTTSTTCASLPRFLSSEGLPKHSRTLGKQAWALSGTLSNASSRKGICL
jgi:hypothetical protein